MQNWICYLIIFIVPYLTTGFCRMGNEKKTPNKASPPSYIYKIVWPILYFLIATSWALNHRHGANFEVDAIYLINCLLGAYWIYSYSSECKDDKKQAFYLLLGLVATTIIMMILSLKYINMSAILLSPYLTWLLFATLLNYTSVTKDQ